jgi:hypothetical protein
LAQRPAGRLQHLPRGIVAAGCPRAEITVVGHRHECLPVGWNNSVDKLRLFASEIAIARSLLIHRDHHVISCGFAFPILDGLESIAFDVVMPSISDGTAVVAPAGNESTTCRYWPAAHDRVIGVASTDRTGVAKADFSNWGTWADCCSIGEDVLSTFADVEAFPQDSDPPAGATTPHFDGWARWDGTSFAAPKVAAKIAEMFAANSSVSPRAHASALLTTAGVTDDGVELPYVA